MATTVNITGTQRQGAYADIVSFLNCLGTQFGSATNAAAVLLRRSPEYLAWVESQKNQRQRRKAG